jgi:regulatory protein
MAGLLRIPLSRRVALIGIFYRDSQRPLYLRVSILLSLPCPPFDFQLSTVNLLFVFTSSRPYFYACSMFGRRPRQLETETELYDVAVRALMRRAHSVHEMKQKLERRSDNKLLVQVVMARLKENGQIDDARYAKQFARQRTEGRKQGKFRISRDLRARGVPDRHIDAALKETAEQTDEAAMVRQRIERKLRSYRGEIDEKKMASIYSSLLRAGFSADVVRRELKAITREEVPDVETE